MQKYHGNKPHLHVQVHKRISTFTSMLRFLLSFPFAPWSDGLHDWRYVSFLCKRYSNGVARAIVDLYTSTRHVSL